MHLKCYDLSIILEYSDYNAYLLNTVLMAKVIITMATGSTSPMPRVPITCKVQLLFPTTLFKFQYQQHKDTASLPGSK